MPMKTVQPHSVKVSMSPQAEIKKEVCAKQVNAISTIIKCDQNRYSRLKIVGASVCCNGQAPLNFNMMHCDGNEKVLSLTFGNGLYIFKIFFPMFLTQIQFTFCPNFDLLSWFTTGFYSSDLKIEVTFILTKLECKQFQQDNRFYIDYAPEFYKTIRRD